MEVAWQVAGCQAHEPLAVPTQDSLEPYEVHTSAHIEQEVTFEISVPTLHSTPGQVFASVEQTAVVAFIMFIVPVAR